MSPRIRSVPEGAGSRKSINCIRQLRRPAFNDLDWVIRHFAVINIGDSSECSNDYYSLSIVIWSLHVLSATNDAQSTLIFNYLPHSCHYLVVSMDLGVHFEQHTRPTPGLPACLRPSLPASLRYRYLETLSRCNKEAGHPK